jgi:hypothetical protein
LLSGAPLFRDFRKGGAFDFAPVTITLHSSEVRAKKKETEQDIGDIAVRTIPSTGPVFRGGARRCLTFTGAGFGGGLGSFSAEGQDYRARRLGATESAVAAISEIGCWAAITSTTKTTMVPPS